MVFHDHVSVEGYSVLTLKIGQRFEKDVGNRFAPEQGQPVDCRAGDEVGISFFNNFVAASAHMVRLCLSGMFCGCCFHSFFTSRFCGSFPPRSHALFPPRSHAPRGSVSWTLCVRFRTQSVPAAFPRRAWERGKSSINYELRYTNYGR
jgi:hypothetical protein